MEKDMKCFAMRDKSLPYGKRRFIGGVPTLVDECVALECNCPGTFECPFYKTQDQLDADKRKAFERINSLPEYRQLGISVKYYGGQMPWRTAAEG